MGQAAAAIGITREAMRHRIEKGWRCDADMKDTRLSYPTRRLQRLNDAHIAARNTE